MMMMMIMTNVITNDDVVVLDACMSEPCQNNGTCISGSDNYTCSCPPGTNGTDCENSQYLFTTSQQEAKLSLG